MQSAEQLALIAFSTEIADSLVQCVDLYPELHASACWLDSTQDSVSTQSEMIELRKIAGDTAQVMTVFSRTIEITAEGFQAHGIESQHHPAPVRSLVQDIAESCLLISHLTDSGQMADAPVIAPDQLLIRFERPQLAAWIEANRTIQTIQPAVISEPIASDPSYEFPGPEPQYDSSDSAENFPPSYLPLGPSPYPATDPSDPQPSIAPAPDYEQQFVQPIEEPGEDDTWQGPGAPGSLPGDRSR